MNHDRMFATLTLAAMLGFAAPAAHAEYLPPDFEARLQMAADGGPASLNQMLYRTRAIHNVSMDEALHHVQLSSTDDVQASAGSFEPTEAAQASDTADESGSSPKEDAFAAEFFRNDPRD